MGMILADTSIWTDHLRSPLSRLAELASADEVLMHSMVIGELACGTLSDREKRLSAWRRFPMISEASHQEVLSATTS